MALLVAFTLYSLKILFMVLFSFMLQIFSTGTESNLGTVMAHLLVGKVKIRLARASTHYKFFPKTIIFFMACKTSQSEIYHGGAVIRTSAC